MNITEHSIDFKITKQVGDNKYTQEKSLLKYLQTLATKDLSSFMQVLEKHNPKCPQIGTKATVV